MRLLTLVGLLVTIVLTFLAIRNISLSELAASAQTANYGLILIAGLVWIVGYTIRALRWQLILRPSVTSPYLRIAKIMVIGFMANNLLPARIGEFVRAFALSKAATTTKSFGLATIMVERMFDGLALLALLMLSSRLYQLPVWSSEIATLSSAVFLVALAGVIFALARRDQLVKLAELLLALLPERLSRFGNEKGASFLSGLDGLRSPGRTAGIIASSLAVWCVEALAYLLVLLAFNAPLAGIEWIAAPLLFVSVINLGIMLPSAPGYIGLVEFFGPLALGAFGVGREPALAMTIVAHAVQYVLITGPGLAFAASESISWSALREAKAS